jgi:imidazole glycerol phosphate synthase subunit HisF
MNLRIALTVVDIVLLAAVLAYFLMRVAAGLTSIASVLDSVAGGVVSIESDARILHPGADAINSNLNAAARNLTTAVGHAQALGGG